MNDVGVAFHQQGQIVVADLRHVHGLEARPEHAQPVEPGEGALLALLDSLLDLKCGLVHVHLDRGIQLVGDHPDLLQVLIAHGIGRMRAEGDFDAWMVNEVVEQFDAVVQGFSRGVGTWNRKIQHRDGDLRAHAAGMDAFGGHLGVEIHVGETRDAALELLGDGQIGAVTHEVFIDPLAFGGPDVVLQPGHQWQVVGQSAKQGHRRMAVGVDQARAEQHAGQFLHLHGVLPQRLGTWTDIDDTAIANADAVVLEHDACGLDRHQPGGQEQKVERCCSVRHEKVSIVYYVDDEVYPSVFAGGSL